ncbi:MAG: TonB family protein, partial [Deltaproteobacteria bacterium]
MRRRRKRRGAWALFLLLSALINWGGLLLFVLLFWGEAVPPTTITYLDLTEDAEFVEAPPEAPRPEPPEPSILPKPEPPKPRPVPRNERERKKPDLELEELPEPEKEEEKKEEPKEREEPKDEPPVQPQHFVLEQLKMVEQPDEVDEAEVPDTYDYLSNVNRDVEEQTRAVVTNLERDATTPKATPREQAAEKTPGTSDATKIARLEERRSRLDRKAPDVRRETEEKRTEAPDRKRSLLAMRDLEPRRHQTTEDENDPMASVDEQGELGRKQDQSDTVVRNDAVGASRDPSKVARFRLTRNDMDALYGKDVEAQRDMMSSQASEKKGIWDGPRDRWQSPLENMVPEVRPGNQTALRSRKHPFARYIATMHRAIHESWAWGFLDQLDMRGNGHPLNRRELWTRLEIVLNADGTIAKVTTVRPSGNLVFDAAARETVWAVGPFPPPPRSIVSPNGKVYIHWAFHRDERACGTFGATPFILDGTGGDRPDPNVEVRPVRGATRRLARNDARSRPRVPAPMGPAAPPSGRGPGAPAPGPAKQAESPPA